MTDIIERLQSIDCSWNDEGEIAAAAADEIERLRAELSDATIKLENEKVGAEEIYQENDRLMHDCQNFLNEIERLREALAELYAADLAPRDANHGREWQNALRKAEAALRKPEPTP